MSGRLPNPCGEDDGAPPELARLVRFWQRAERVVVTSGAGLSAESGIPTFRDAGSGLWARFDPMRLASEAGFRADPARVYAWYRWRQALVARAVPHAGYHALARLVADSARQVLCVTQNVDDLHERVGIDPVLHLHGRLDAWRCLECATPHAGVLPEIDLASPPERLEPPACVACGAPVRPGVVWFGEALSEAVLAAAREASAHCQLMLVVGSSGMVQPAASLPDLARRCGARVVVINPEVGTAADLWWRSQAAPALVALARALGPESGT